MGRRHRASRRPTATVKPKPAVSDAAFKAAFFDYVKRLTNTICRTLTATPSATAYVKPGRDRARPSGYFFFAQSGSSGPRLARLESRRFGQVGLYLGQTCEPGDKSAYPLKTIQYRYALHVAETEEPFVRWEYNKTLAEGAFFCRHHVQGTIDLRIGDQAIQLENPYHLPTGYVTIEEVLRFCITDLEVAPLVKDWHEVLERGYQDFKTKSAPRIPR